MNEKLVEDFPGKLLYNATQVIVMDMDGKKHYGTGFWYETKINMHTVLLLVTARHVFDNHVSASIIVCKKGVNNKPIDRDSFELSLNSEYLDKFLFKDEQNDICTIVMKINGTSKIQLMDDAFLIPVTNEIFIDFNAEEDYMLMQEMVMIGYPLGIYDDYNNKPLLKRGVTATPAKLDFKGKQQFLLDISCHHGSSGSPVFIIDKGVYVEKNAILPGPRLKFAGIFVGGWEDKVESIYICDGKENKKDVQVKFKIPNNLGLVIKSVCLERLLLKIEQKLFSNVYCWGNLF